MLSFQPSSWRGARRDRNREHVLLRRENSRLLWWIALACPSLLSRVWCWGNSRTVEPKATATTYQVLGTGICQHPDTPMFRNTRSGARDSLPTPGNGRGGNGDETYDAGRGSKPAISESFIATIVWALVSCLFIGVSFIAWKPYLACCCCFALLGHLPAG